MSTRLSLHTGVGKTPAHPQMSANDRSCNSESPTRSMEVSVEPLDSDVDDRIVLIRVSRQDKPCMSPLTHWPSDTTQGMCPSVLVWSRDSCPLRSPLRELICRKT